MLEKKCEILYCILHTFPLATPDFLCAARVCSVYFDFCYVFKAAHSVYGKEENCKF